MPLRTSLHVVDDNPALSIISLKRETHRLGVAPSRRPRLPRRCRKLRDQSLCGRHGPAVSRYRDLFEGRNHGVVRLVGTGRRGLARMARNAAHALMMGAIGVGRQSPTRLRSVTCGLTGAGISTCIRHGFARATMCSAILRYCLRPWGCSGRARAGLT